VLVISVAVRLLWIVPLLNKSLFMNLELVVRLFVELVAKPLTDIAMYWKLPFALHV